MASVSNTYNSYVLNGAYTSLYKTSNPKASNLEEKNQTTNKDTKQILDDLLKDEDKLSGYVSYSYIKDNIQSLENSTSNRYQFLASYHQEIPSNNDYEASLEFLIKEFEDILITAYEKQPNSEEFKNLLGAFRNLKNNIQDFKESKDDLLKLLEKGQQNEEFFKSKEFNNKLLNTINNTNTIDLDEANKNLSHNQENGILNNYRINSAQIADELERFFSMANDFGLISNNKQDNIHKALQTGYIYLGSQSGNIGNSFKVGDFTISWEGNNTLHNALLEGNILSITSNKPTNELLTSLSSNLDSTQSFFDMLEQREKLEKENQELQNKRGLNLVNNPYIETKSDGILKEVLKSKDKEIGA